MLLCVLHLACLHALCNAHVGMILLGTMVKCSCTALNYMYVRMVSFYATYCNRVHMTLPKLVGNARHDLLLLVYPTESAIGKAHEKQASLLLKIELSA